MVDLDRMHRRLELLAGYLPELQARISPYHTLSSAREFGDRAREMLSSAASSEEDDRCL